MIINALIKLTQHEETDLCQLINSSVKLANRVLISKEKTLKVRNNLT